MATKKTKGKVKVKVTRKSPRKQAVDKGLMQALKGVEEMAMEQIGTARDPFKTGMQIVGEIKKMTLRLENEIDYDSRALTEAYDSDPGVVGVGVGVF